MNNDAMRAFMPDMTASNKKLVVLANCDYPEAMRVAAGLTIFGHHVELIFANGVVEENAENVEQAELLELSDIEPFSLTQDPNVERINDDQFFSLLLNSEHVIRI